MVHLIKGLLPDWLLRVWNLHRLPLGCLEFVGPSELPMVWQLDSILENKFPRARLAVRRNYIVKVDVGTFLLVVEEIVFVLLFLRFDFLVLKAGPIDRHLELLVSEVVFPLRSKSERLGVISHVEQV